MGETWTEAGFQRELGALGELEVQIRLDAGTWGGPRDQKAQIALKWLRAQERARAESAQAAADRRAKHATLIAILALLVSFAGLIVSFAALFVRA